MDDLFEVEIIMDKGLISYGVTEQLPGMVVKLENNEVFLGAPDFPYLTRKYLKLFKKNAQYGEEGMYNFIRAIISKGHVPKVISWSDAISTTPLESAIMLEQENAF